MTKKKILILIPMLLLGLVFQYKTIFEGHPWIGGSFQYLIQAKAIQENTIGSTIDILNEFHNQADIEIPGVYPWGYPLFIAGFNHGDLSQFTWYKYTNLWMFIASSVMWFFWSFKRIGNWSFLVLFLMLFNPYLSFFKGIIYSDIPFLFFTSIYFLWLDKLKVRRSVLDIVVLGILFVWCVMVRTQGVLLIIPVLLIFKKDGKKWGVFLFPIFVYFFFIRIMIFPGSGYSYVYSLQDSLGMVRENILYYASQMYRLFYFKHEKDNWAIMAYVVFLPFLWIGVFNNKKSHLSLTVFLAVNFLLLICWPFQEGPRFLIFLLPLMFYFCVLGIKQFVSLYKLFYVVPFIFLLVYVRNNKSAWIHGHHEKHGVSDEGSKKLFEYVKAHPENEYVFYRPRVLYWYTQIKSKALTIEKAIPFNDFRWIKVKNEVALQYSGEVLKDMGYSLKNVFETNHFEIFEVKTEMK